jgi:DNA-binding CsgD family transcriptional regulator
MRTAAEKPRIETVAAELLRRIANGESKTLLAREFGVTRDTVYQYMARAG